MSITDIPPFKHLSKNWTIEQVVTLAKSSVSNLEMEIYPLPWHTVRMLYNQALGDIEDIIFTAENKLYEIVYPVLPEENEYNIYAVNLGIAVFDGYKAHGEVFYTQDDYFPVQHIKSILGAFCSQKGSFIEKSFEELLAVASEENNLYRHSMFYARNGDIVYFYGGERIDFATDKIYIRALRRIVLDDLKHPKTSDVANMTIDEIILEPNGDRYSWTYDKNIDIPDRYVRLLNLQMKKECFEYLSQPIPEELESKIASIIRTLTTGVELKQVENQQLQNKVM